MGRGGHGDSLIIVGAGRVPTHQRRSSEVGNAAHTSNHSPYYSSATDAGVHDGNHVSELALEDGVKVGAAAKGNQAIAVRQLREHADLAAVFELCAYIQAWCA